MRQVEQGSAKVLQAVDWPQSGPDNGKDQVLEDQRQDSGESAEHEATRQVTDSCSLPGEPVQKDVMAPSACEIFNHGDQCRCCVLMQGAHEGGPQKQRWWVVARAKQGFRQLQKLNLAFQDWTERFWKASAAIALLADHSRKCLTIYMIARESLDNLQLLKSP